MISIQSPNGVLLAIEHVDISYQGSIVALKDVSLSVSRGAIVALLGANGAGKTSMLRAISGLLSFHSGRVTAGKMVFGGLNVLGADAPTMVRRGVAQVMEARRIFADLTVQENLVAGSFSRRSRHEIAESLERAFEMFPVLRERSEFLAGYLSGGEQQMLAIARAMMARPQLLLLDEPSLGIAPKIVAQLVAVIRQINAAGTTIVLVEQNAHLALGIADHAVVLENGRVAMQGAASTLRDHPRIRDIYLGKSGEDGARRSFKRVDTSAAGVSL